MKLKVKLDTKTLTKINTVMFEKCCIKVNPRSLKARHRIMFYLQDKQTRYYINTPYHTSNTRMCGCNFHDTEFNVVDNAKLTMALKDLYSQCNKFIDEHWEWDIISIKDGIRAILGADTPEEAKESADNIKRHEVLKYIDDVVLPTKSRGTAEIYRGCEHYIKEYMALHKNKPIYIEDMGVEWMKDFNNFLCTFSKKPLADSTINRQFRCIKHVLNCAREAEIINSMPFGKTSVKFNMPKQHYVRQFVMTPQEFADFRDYPVSPAIQKYKDMALLSFYLNGMNFSDLLNIKEIINGRIEFNRTKTDVPSSFLVHPEAMRIINKYRGKKQLLNALDTTSLENFISKCNKRIKRVGYEYVGEDKVGKKRKYYYLPLFPNISVLTFRRSIATMLADIDCPTEVINMALSHASFSPYLTTEIYIVRNRKKVDLWTRKLFDELAKVKGRSKEEIDEELKQRYGIV